MERHPPPSQPNCPGCGRSFTPPGRTSHLKQTHNPRCRAIADRQNNFIPEDPPPSDKDILPDPLHFPGDFFANDYGPDDFPWDADDPDEDPELDDAESLPPGSEVDEFDTDSDPDLDDFYQDLDVGWEPPVANPGVHRGVADNDNEDNEDNEDNDMDGDGAPPPVLPQPSTAHDAL
jgi:hypothetical protein